MKPIHWAGWAVAVVSLGLLYAVVNSEKSAKRAFWGSRQ